MATVPRALRHVSAVRYGLLAPAIVLVTGSSSFRSLFGCMRVSATRRGRRQGASSVWTNALDLITDGDFWSSTLRSLIFVVGMRCVGTALALLFASALYRATSRLRFPGHVDRPMALSSIGAPGPFGAVRLRTHGCQPFLALFRNRRPILLGTPVLAMVVVSILAQVVGDLPLSIRVCRRISCARSSQIDCSALMERRLRVGNGSGAWLPTWRRSGAERRPSSYPRPHLARHHPRAHRRRAGHGDANLFLMFYEIAFRQLDLRGILARADGHCAGCSTVVAIAGYVGMSRRFGGGAMIERPGAALVPSSTRHRVVGCTELSAQVGDGGPGDSTSSFGDLDSRTLRDRGIVS